MRRFKVKNKRKSAKRFNKNFHRTKKPNLRRTIMRGGYRL